MYDFPYLCISFLIYLISPMIRLLLLFVAAFGTLVPAAASETGSLLGRPYTSFDATAFCSYTTFHPSQYLTDNNWDILCAFTQPGQKSRLDSLGISASASQLRLLEVGGLLGRQGKEYSTLMPIFGKEETRLIREESKNFADSIFPSIRPDLQKLVAEFRRLGFDAQTYSLVFSCLLDGYIWDESRLPTQARMTDHGTWSGAFWAMYESRPHLKTGTNSYGPLSVNWTDSLGYYPGSAALIALASEIIKSDGSAVTDSALAVRMSAWGLTDTDGNLTVPVIRRNSGDPVDSLCVAIATTISDAVKRHCTHWPHTHGINDQDLAQVIFYHEVLWDLLDLCESGRIISVPAILKGQEVGRHHFGDITFIVLNTPD